MTVKTILSEKDHQQAMKRYVTLASLCLANNQSFRYFENHYAVPAHISPIAWSRAVDLANQPAPIENECLFKELREGNNSLKTNYMELNNVNTN